MAAVDAIEEVIDLTMVLDPADIWPDPAACPDWPLLPRNHPDSVITGRAPAEQRLANLSRSINGTSGRLRPPSAKERAALRAEHFREGSDPAVLRYGIPDLAPIHPYQPGKAPVIAEATLIRGYLRKLDAAAATEREAAEEKRLAGLRRRVERYGPALSSIKEKLVEGADGAARYRQHLVDEKAYHDEIVLKRQLADMHRDAASAANELGIDPPSRPEAAS